MLVGGYPGEWEGEHPWDVVRETGARDVFLAGWHDHDELPELLCGADALALASVAEQFGSVLVEGMACGLPPVAVDRMGPADIVDAGRTGWLVEPDDEAGLAAALTEVLADPGERARRAVAARADALARFSWPALGARLADLLDVVARRAAASAAGAPGVSGARVAEVVLADDAATWGALGFAVDGAVRSRWTAWRCGSPGARRGRGCSGSRSTARPPARRSTASRGWSPARRRPPAAHPNGVCAVDHVVVRTPSVPRTVRALQDAGLDLRATRDVPLAPATGGPLQQAFLLAGACVVEVVGPPAPGDAGDGGAALWGRHARRARPRRARAPAGPAARPACATRCSPAGASRPLPRRPASPARSP